MASDFIRSRRAARGRPWPLAGGLGCAPLERRRGWPKPETKVGVSGGSGEKWPHFSCLLSVSVSVSVWRLSSLPLARQACQQAGKLAGSPLVHRRAQMSAQLCRVPSGHIAVHKQSSHSPHTVLTQSTKLAQKAGGRGGKAAHRKRTVSGASTGQRGTIGPRFN